MFKKMAREPLIHFLAIGVAMFVVFGLVGRPVEDTGRKIEINQAVINTLVSGWEKQWNRPPTAAELKGLIDKTVREEIFYREAVQMGLDVDDSVVRRRLAQKLEFLIQDISAPAAPVDSELQAYLDSHQEMFEQPARYSFNQVYLNPDRRGANIRDDAGQLLIKLRNLSSIQDLAVFGDRLMLETHYREINEHQLDRLFGRGFASQLADLPAGTWSGPVESGYGLHLVYLEAIVPSRTPSLAEVRQAVEQEWLATMQKEANEQVYRRLRDQYQVLVEDWQPPLANPITGD